LLRQAGISKEGWLKRNNPQTPFFKGERSQSGLSIIATVMALLILALFAAAAVSLVTTSTGSGIQEERGVEAFYIAEGGMQYTLKKNTYPYYAVSSTTLGDGSFTVEVPTLTSSITSGDNNPTVDVSSTEGFVQAAPPSTDTSYWILLCDTAASATPTVTMSSDCEKISCTTKSSTSFSTCTRGRDSTVSATFDHQSTAVVMMYMWKSTVTTSLARDFAKGAKCNNAPSRICVSDTTGFATSGFIRITNASENNIEDVFYDGIGAASDCGSTCTTGCLGTTSCTRSAFDGGGNGTATHASGTTIYQSEYSVIVTSTGITPGAIILTDIKRVLQTNVLPLKDP